MKKVNLLICALMLALLPSCACLKTKPCTKEEVKKVECKKDCATNKKAKKVVKDCKQKDCKKSEKKLTEEQKTEIKKASKEVAKKSAKKAVEHQQQKAAKKQATKNTQVKK